MTSGGLSDSRKASVQLAARSLCTIESHMQKVLAKAQHGVVTGFSTRVVAASASAEAARCFERTRSVCDRAARVVAPSGTMLDQSVRFGFPRLRSILQHPAIEAPHSAARGRRPSDQLRRRYVGSLIASKAVHILPAASATSRHVKGTDRQK